MTHSKYSDCFMCKKEADHVMTYSEHDWKPFAGDHPKVIRFLYCSDHREEARYKLIEQLNKDLPPVPCEKTYQQMKKQMYGE